MNQKNLKALVISVGDHVDTVTATINRLQPECLCFFSSEETRPRIDTEIIPKIERPPKQWDQIVTPDADNLLKSCRVLIKGLPVIVKRWEAEPSQVIVDYTDGAKTLSTALVLCAIQYSSNFRFTGVQGSDQAIEGNPWDELSAHYRSEVALVFNRGRYREAADVFGEIQKHVSASDKPLYKTLANLSLGYASWDAFDYRQAWNKLQESKKALEMATVFGGPPGLKGVVFTLKENLSFLEKIVLGAQEVKPEIFLDLLANARRRAQHDQKYEDAMARVYRALEVLVQVRLGQKGVRTSAADPASLPASLREEFVQKYTSQIDGKIKIGLQPGYRFLKILGDDLGEIFEKQWNNLKVLLEVRNKSILAHGFSSVKPEHYQQVFDMVIKISGRRIEELPRFPRMEF